MQNYFIQIKSLWDFAKNATQQNHSADFFWALENLAIIENYVPMFIRDPEISEHSLLAAVSQGISIK